MARRVDVLPAPFGPSRATRSPVSIDKSTPRTASTAPYETSRPRTSIIGDSQVRVHDATVLPHLGGAALGDDATELEDNQAVAQPVDEVNLVIDDQDRHAFGSDPFDQAGQVGGLGVVQPG